MTVIGFVTRWRDTEDASPAQDNPVFNEFVDWSSLRIWENGIEFVDLDDSEWVRD